MQHNRRSSKTASPNVSTPLLCAISLLIGATGSWTLRSSTLWNWIRSSASVNERQSAIAFPDPTQRTVTILVTGQSNAANFGAVRTEAGSGTFTFHNDKFFPCVDPIAGVGGTGGSPWPLLAQRLLTVSDVDQVVVANVAAGSTSIADWQPPGSLFERFCETSNQLTEHGFPVDFVIWYQGESDVVNSTSLDAYQSGLRTLIQRAKDRGVNSKWIVNLCSRFSSTPLWLPVREAQLAVIASESQTLPGVDTDALGTEFRYDNIHLNLAGQQRIANETFQLLRAELEASQRDDK